MKEKELEEKAKKSFRSFYDKELFMVFLDGYRSGADEQLEMFIDKAWEWISDNRHHPMYEDEFRKAMKE